MALIENELYAALLSLAVLIPYYFVLWLNKTRLKFIMFLVIYWFYSK